MCFSAFRNFLRWDIAFRLPVLESLSKQSQDLLLAGQVVGGDALIQPLTFGRYPAYAIEPILEDISRSGHQVIVLPEPEAVGIAPLVAAQAGNGIGSCWVFRVHHRGVLDGSLLGGSHLGFACACFYFDVVATRRGILLQDCDDAILIADHPARRQGDLETRGGRFDFDTVEVGVGAVS